jgi:hypothetical protein
MENILIVGSQEATVQDLTAARDYTPLYNGVVNNTLSTAKSVQFIAKKTNGDFLNFFPALKDQI